MKLRIVGVVLTIPLITLSVPNPKLFCQSKSETYGNTPEEILPYRHFRQPYKLFFDEPQPFLGTGREKKPPKNLKEVKLGFLGPLYDTPDSLLGRRMLQGAMLALEEANADGGYHGIPFKLVIRSDNGLWGASGNEFVALDDAKVWAVLGSIDGTSTHVALRVALKVELPFINTGGTDPTLTETRIPWFIRCIADDRQNSYALALYVYKVKRYKRVAVLRNNNRYGRVGIVEFNDASRRLGRPIVLELRYASGDTNYTTQLDRIRKSSAEAVVIWENDSKVAGLIVKQIRAMGMQHAIFGPDRFVSSDFIQVAGHAAEGIVATYPYNPTLDHPYLQDFNRSYFERFGEEAEEFAAHAYDGMKIMIAAVHTVGLNRVLIRDVLTALKTYRGVTGEIIFDASHNDVGRIWMAEVRQGKFRYFPSPLSLKNEYTKN